MENMRALTIKLPVDLMGRAVLADRLQIRSCRARRLPAPGRGPFWCGVGSPEAESGQEKKGVITSTSETRANWCSVENASSHSRSFKNSSATLAWPSPRGTSKWTPWNTLKVATLSAALLCSCLPQREVRATKLSETEQALPIPPEPPITVREKPPTLTLPPKPQAGAPDVDVKAYALAVKQAKDHHRDEMNSHQSRKRWIENRHKEWEQERKRILARRERYAQGLPMLSDNTFANVCFISGAVVAFLAIGGIIALHLRGEFPFGAHPHTNAWVIP